MLRFGAYLFIAIALVFIVDAAIDQFSGHAKAFAPSKRIHVVQATQKDDPKTFKSIMSYQWIRAFTLLGAGYFLLSAVRRSEKLDPFST